MRITRFNLGEHASISPIKAGGLAYDYGGYHWQLGEPRREVPSNEISYDRLPTEPSPFDRADFGDRDRLAWPCGACTIQQDITLVSWAKRYGMWFEDSWLHAVDATRALLVRVGLPIMVQPVKSAVFHGTDVCLQSDRDLVVLPFGQVEHLFEGTTGSLRVDVRELYPHERPAAKVKMFIEYIFTDSAYLVDRDTGAGRVSIPLVPGLEQGAMITLHDELMRGHYGAVEVPGYPRVTLHERQPHIIHPCELFVEPAIDPAGPLVTPSAAVRTDELERLFVQLADDPDDDAARIVAVDLLEEAGEPYAPQLAKLLAGETDADARREALGTLASYLFDVEWRGNLPWAAELSSAAPNDEAIGDLVAADYRLGFFHTLRLGEGNFRVYNKLVASPRSLGLRHVDGSRASILQALIRAGRRDLRRLSNVKFVSREVLEALADPTFDRTLEIETETQTHLVARLLDYIARDELGFFSRAPRHLVLRERGGEDETLVASVLDAWPRLRLDQLTLGGITIARDGTAIADDDASDLIRKQVATRFRFGS